MDAAIPKRYPDNPLLMRWVASIASMGKVRLILICASLISLIAFADFATAPSLGVFYIVPMILAATVLSPAEITILALVCAILRGVFDYSAANTIERIFRFLFAGIAYASAGVFTTFLIRSHQQVLAQTKNIVREQTLRLAAEERFQVLVHSSPAAILTLDETGGVIAANDAAAEIFGSEEVSRLLGRSIREYLPLLYEALQFDDGKEVFRTAAQCQGRRQNGEPFLASAWFSTYSTPEGRHLAAIIVDISEEMRNQEEQKLLQLSASSRIMAAAASHEIRNLCNAISLIWSSLKANPKLTSDAGFKTLGDLVKGLEEMASLNLHSISNEALLQPVHVKELLDTLQIIIQPDWEEIGGTINWEIPLGIRPVLADSQGLLQALLNLARNSHRAVQDGAVRQLTIAVSSIGTKTLIAVGDSGPGIANPAALFQPFQTGAASSGLGLYISRGLIRSYGGELRLEPGNAGAHFSIELQSV